MTGYLTLTSVVFEFLARYLAEATKLDLTLTSVVFELKPFASRSYFWLVRDLTLTSVVFELKPKAFNFVSYGYLTLTSVVFELK